MKKEMTVQELRSKILRGDQDYVLLDVRNQDEYDLVNIQGQHIPLPELSERLDEIDRTRKIILHCHSGQRSAQAVKILQQAGFNQVFNLTGGIDAWAQEIDNSLPRY